MIQKVYAQNPSVVNLDKQFAYGNLTDFGSTLSHLALPVFGFAATMLVFYFLIAGVKFIVSEGDKASVQEAKRMITHSLIGFLLLILLFLIMRFIPQFFGLNIQII